MISINDERVFEQYYQACYDFNTSALSEQEIDRIKALAKEKRVNYALAPIGEKIFDFISEQCSDINFELVQLDSDNIDGMLYIPVSGSEKAYIIINGRKPFVNQIFAAAHEYYHYICDYEEVKEKPYICSLSSLKNSIEKKASRFAAELLLPEEALKNEIKNFKRIFNIAEKRTIGFADYAYISMLLTVKYGLPLKAVIYRLHEEGFVSNINTFIKNYDVIKCVLLQIEMFKERVGILYSIDNNALDNEHILYQQMEKAYRNGLASREEILKDAETLRLNKNIINLYFDNIEEEDESEAENEIISVIKQKWRGR